VALSFAEILAAAVPDDTPGAVALVVRDGQPGEPVVAGEAVRYATDELLAEERVPMRADTIFDVASLTKLFTATAVLTLVQDGVLDLEDKVTRWLPEFGHDAVTLRHLLTHTSGLPAHLNLWARPDPRAAIFTAPVAGPPGTVFDYSCLGYITAGWVAESASGQALRDLVANRICTPLGLRDTGYLPSPELLPRIAATEYQPYVHRGMVRGSVHDENSWNFGGAVGNAGIFSTATDLARFGEMLRRGGERILAPELVAEMTTDQLPASLDPGYRQGLGPRISDRSFMGVLADSGAFGHTGFTGTSLVVNHDLVLVLLTNRVHPHRDRSSVMALRQRIAAASIGQ
jgi:CubicO group peptidase (beta-lactamase class C family)